MAKVRTPVRVPAPLSFQRAAVDPMALLLQAQQLLAAGQHENAITLIRAVLSHEHLQPEANYLLGRALKANGDIDGAETAYRQALALRPGYVEALVSLGIVMKMRGDVEAAIALYDQALSLDPSFAPAHANRAGAMALRAALAAENPLDEIPSDEVIEAQAHAVSLAPGNAVVLRNHGVMLMRARRRVEAAQAFNRALTVDPSDVDACIHMGVCLRALGDNQLAIGLYEKWLGINKPSAPVMRALAGLLTREGQVDVARAWAEKAIAVDPDPYALIQLGSTLMQSRRLEEALAHCHRAVELSGGRADIYPTLLLGLTYLHDDPQPIFDAHEAFGRQIKPAATPRPPWRPLAPGERLKVGYVSGDFVRHSVSFFIGGLLERHDKSRFDVTCYHNVGWGDVVTQRLRSYGHQWVECDGMSDELLRRRIEADGIHILVDLSGHTMHSRIFTFGLGAAPVQISYLGYPTVSGVPAVDYRITDSVIDPGDMPPLESERPLCLPRSMFCYRPDEQPPLAPPPVLQAGHITFGSFNNIAKVTDHTLDLWAQAMNAVPHSRLLLKSSSMAQTSNRENIERFMGARGISAGRLSLQPWIASKSSHLELYNQVDVALDPFPYNGATTTCEALWMGVPVVTRRGRTHTSRMGASLLGAIGRDDWVADDDAAYVATILRVAADVVGLARWRSQARERLAESALFDEPGFVRDFEAVLQQAWALAATA
ncbi:MAG: tetratricopeptide repeat protein [Rhizobacter sp.]|nr:tetratricopeptide repeat protein [Rhizobacter sp.]